MCDWSIHPALGEVSGTCSSTGWFISGLTRPIPKTLGQNSPRGLLKEHAPKAHPNFGCHFVPQILCNISGACFCCSVWRDVSVSGCPYEHESCAIVECHRCLGVWFPLKNIGLNSFVGIVECRVHLLRLIADAWRVLWTILQDTALMFC